MLRIPRLGEDQIIGAGQFQSSVWLRLIEDDLRTCDVHDAVAHERVIHIVEAHRPKVVSADATELKAIPLAFGDFHVLEALSPLPDSLKKGTLAAMLVRR